MTRPEPVGKTWLATVALLALVLLTGISWAAASPLIAGPDDDLHVSSAWCVWGYEDGKCEYLFSNSDRDGVKVPALAGKDLCFAVEGPAQSAACQSGSTVPWANSSVYPQGFYAFMSIFAGEDGTRSVLVMRTVSFILCVLMLAGAAFLLKPAERNRTLFIVAAASVPLGVFIFASNNPSGFAIAAETSAFIATVACLRRETWRERILIAAAVVGFIAIAAASRPDGLVLSILAVALAVIVAFPLGRRVALMSVVLGSGLAIILLVLLTVGARYLPSNPFADGLGVWLRTGLSATDYYFGPISVRLGWVDTNPPVLVWMIKTLIVGMALLAAMRIATTRRVVAVTASAAVAVLAPTYWIISGGFSFQTRYVFALFLIVCVILMIDIGRSRVTLSPGQATTIAVLAAVGNSLALNANLRRYITGTDVANLNLDNGIEWWWEWAFFSPNALWITGTLAGLGAALLLARLAARPDDSDSNSEVDTASDALADDAEFSKDNQAPVSGHGLSSADPQISLEK